MDGGKILVVDSDENTVQLATFKLSGAGYWVLTASNAQTALEKIRDLPTLSVKALLTGGGGRSSPVTMRKTGSVAEWS